MDVVIYHNPGCSKSRDTLALLQQRGLQPRVIDYLLAPPGRSELQHLCTLLQLPLRQLVRPSEAVYQTLGLDRPDLTDAERMEALISHPCLLQRPIVVVDQQRAALGRPPEAVLDIL
jgi:arsenate reductase